MNQIEYEVRSICAKLYFGWVEKSEVPLLTEDEIIYKRVEEQLDSLGLELVNRSECKWYVVRVKNEYDSFEQFQKRNQSLKSPHLALLLILYAKLLLPRRVGHVSTETELSVTFQELYQNYGDKFKSKRRKVATEQTLLKLIQTLLKFGFICKVRGRDIYFAGPAMYMLHEDLLSDVAEASLQTLFGIESDVESYENLGEILDQQEED